jgi:hypothetical protein
MREEYRPGAPLDIGAIAAPFHVGPPPSAFDLPPGTVSGSAERIAEYLRPYGDAGVGQVQVRFPTGSVEEQCDQIAAFGETVIPLVDA